VKTKPALFCLLTVVLLIIILSTCSRPASYDLIIRDAQVLDGTGNPSFRADVGVRGQRIAAVGDLRGEKAGRFLEAQGLVVCPGFIDIHTHCDREIREMPGAENYLSQGVTTVIGGNCGSHPFPLRDLFLSLRKTGMGLNLGMLVGHNTIRQKVMGFDMRPPSREEMDRLKRLVEQEMRAGALGLSTGLSYLPGIYADTEELVELASVAARWGGIYATHLRDQGQKIREAIEEAILIGERAGLPVQISHIKLADEAVWNRLELVREPVEAARRRGVEVSLDLYPYTATSSGFTSSFPAWVFEGGVQKFQERIKDADVYRRVREHIVRRRLTSVRGLNPLRTIFIAQCRRFPGYEGRSLDAVLQERGWPCNVESAADLIIDLEKNGGASGIFFQMDEADVESFLGMPWVIIGSDGALQKMGRGQPHPRSYGTFPRVIDRYVRDKGVIFLAEAIRKMTSYPAQVLRFQERGLIRTGLAADLVVFDPQTFADTATYENPHSFSRGLIVVLVNGQVVWENGRPTGRRPGAILYGRGSKS
jgi:N-acyl-D-amino-acid deacylase